jgi:hypothetical protein
LIVAFGVAAAVFCTWLGAAAQAVTVSPTTLADETTANACGPPASNCSLRNAIASAEGTPGGTVVMPASLPGTYTLSHGALEITGDLTITGPGAGTVSISGGGASQLISIPAAATIAAISGVALDDGSLTGLASAGGAVRNSGTLTLTNVTVNGNSVVTGPGGAPSGGAIASSGHLTVIGCNFSDNLVETTSGGGVPRGGAIASTGSLAVSSSTFSNNIAELVSEGGGAEGGAILQIEGALTISGSTFSGNTTKTGTQGGVAVGGAVESIRAAVAISASAFAANLASAGPEAIGEGGAVFGHEGSLAIEGSSFTGNSAGGTNAASVGEGGAVSESAATTIADSSFTANVASGPQFSEGGALAALGGTSSVTASMLAGNSSAGAGAKSVGGALFDGAEGGGVVLVNSTLTGNRSAGFGGGLYNLAGTAKLANATIDANSAGGSGGGGNVFTGGGTVSATDTILAAGVLESGSGGENCAGTPLSSGGFNVEDNQCGVSAPGDKVGANPLLGPLANNGGPTQTQMLLPASPAIDAGNPAGCADPAGGLLSGDQRGVVRPQGARCDAGAYESAPPLVSTGAASAIGVKGATLNASASNPDLLGGSVFFQYGTTTSYGSQTTPQPLLAGASETFHAAVSGFARGTVVHFRAVGVDPDGTSFGADRTFTVAPAPRSPILSEIAESHRVWREGRKLARISRRTRKHPVGTTFSFRLNEQATVSLSFTTRVSGRKFGHKCVAAHKTNAKRRRFACTKTAGILTFSGHAGKNSVVFQGRLASGRKLKPGRYTLIIEASNSAGRSAPAGLAFTIVK